MKFRKDRPFRYSSISENLRSNRQTHSMQAAWRHSITPLLSLEHDGPVPLSLFVATSFRPLPFPAVLSLPQSLDLLVLAL